MYVNSLTLAANLFPRGDHLQWQLKKHIIYCTVCSFDELKVISSFGREDRGLAAVGSNFIQFQEVKKKRGGLQTSQCHSFYGGVEALPGQV